MSLKNRLAFLLLFSSAASLRAANPIDFDRQIRPLLSDNCFSCHGPDAAQRKADLRLDQRDAAVRAGAINEKDWSASLIMERIFSSDAEKVMPPPESTKKLTDAQKQLLKTWIEQGGNYTQHWAFLPPRAPEVPAGAHAIDHLLEQALAREGLSFSPPASPNTLARRLSLDLIGLPPEAQLVDRLVKDPSRETLDRTIEELLSSPHYGERMAIAWLDVVRFADTIGYHSDTPRNVYPYRDYVIHSFNTNKPFDQFTIEQIAGDLLPDATQEQKIASCFNRLLLTTEEGGAQAKDYEARYLADRVRAIGTAWLGLTIGCSQCHDHKFDPITTQDFYSMGAFFADIDEAIIGRREDGMIVPSREQAIQWQSLKVNLSTLESEWNAPHPQLATEQQNWQTEQLALANARSAWQPLHATQATTASETQLAIQEDRAILASGKPAATENYKLTFKLDEATEIAALQLEALPHASLPAGGSGRAGNGNFVLSQVTATIESSDGSSRDIAFESARASFEQTQRAEKHPHKRWSAASVIDRSLGVPPGNRSLGVPPGERSLGVPPGNRNPLVPPGDPNPVVPPGKTDTSSAPKKTTPEKTPPVETPATHIGWAILPEVTKPQQLQIKLAAPIKLDVGDSLVIQMQQSHDNPNHSLGHFRWSHSRDPLSVTAPLGDARFDEVVTILRIDAKDRKPEQLAKLREAFYRVAPALAPLREKIEVAKKELKEFEDKLPRCLVSKSLEKPRLVRILPRGNWQDESGTVVAPRLPAFLTANVPTTDRPLNRLDLARWIVARDNPLTARVFVNRLWKQFFGIGLAKNLDDLGAQGEAPVHAGLLDYLAVQFMQSGWDVKHIVRLIVSSRAYQQSSLGSPELLERDPENRLIARQSRYRLPAELVRDNALAIGGLLSPVIGGPSVKPYQPEGYWENLNFPVRSYTPDPAPAQHRRGLYVWWQRSFVHPSMLAFDAPTREECAADRPQSNIPQQALVLLNDPTYLEAARGLAVKMASNSSATSIDSNRRIADAFQRATARQPRENELALLSKLFATSKQQFTNDEEAAKALITAGSHTAPPDISPADLAAYIQTARAILNLHEVITRN